MAAASVNHTIDEVVDALSRASISAQNVRLGDNSTFQQHRNININVTDSGQSSTDILSSANNIPDLLSPYFLGRDDELGQIRSTLENPDAQSTSRCILHGMPGLGKTQLALKFVDTAYRESRYPYIFWISATSADKFIQGYSGILDVIAFPISHQVDAGARCNTVRSWLEGQKTHPGYRWLVILDNVTTETITKLRELLPRSNPSGHILFTTRSDQIAEQLAMSFGSNHLCLGLKALGTSDALSLLVSRSRSRKDALVGLDLDIASEIVTLSRGLPLAIFQIASYMKASGCNLQQMLDKYRDEKEKVGLVHDKIAQTDFVQILGWQNADLSTYDGKSLQATYSIALKDLTRKSPSTVDMLRILVFLDPEGISEDILKGGGYTLMDSGFEREKTVPDRLGPFDPPKLSIISITRKKIDDSRLRKIATRLEVCGTSSQQRAAKALGQVLQNEIKFSQALQELQDLSIVAKEHSGSHTLLRIHDLVQEVLFSELMKEDADRRFWFARAVHLVGVYGLPADRHWYSPKWRRIIPQAAVLKNHSAKHRYRSLVLCELCSIAAGYLFELCDFDSAETLQDWLGNEFLAILGSKHFLTLGSTIRLARVYIMQGNLEEAERLINHTISIEEKHGRTRSYNTSLAKEVLGWVFLGRMRFREAGEMFLSSNIRSGSSITGLASAYHRQGKFDDAEATLQQVINLGEEQLAVSETERLDCMVYLGWIYIEREKYEDAEMMLLRVIQICANLETLSLSKFYAQGGLGLIYAVKGELDKARDLQLDLLKRNFGNPIPPFPSISVCLRSLAETMWKLGEEDTATECMRLGDEKIVEADHPDMKQLLQRLQRSLPGAEQTEASSEPKLHEE